MTGNFFESETKENLMRAFAGESQARNRYTIAAEKAREKGIDVYKRQHYNKRKRSGGI